MLLKDKDILVVSPQHWNHIKLSKHHYAMELAQKGNNVYFLNPPGGSKFFQFKKTRINDRLTVIDHSLFFPYNLRFHFPFLFQFLLRFHIKRINKYLGNVDIVWSFSSFYIELKRFSASLAIFHPVDMQHDEDFLKMPDHCDYIFGVSEAIVSKLDHPKKFLIEHGVSSMFFSDKLRSVSPKSTIDVAYCGNLCVPAIDRPLVIKLVKSYRNVTFHFIGPYDKGERLDFIEELKQAENVRLHGKVTPDRIAEVYQEMDAFILCYNRLSAFSKSRNRSSNSHKLLEYLSTGKVVISTNMSAYNDKKGVLEMLATDGNEGYIDLFDKVINNLADYNSSEKVEFRKNYARDNSYSARIKQIESIISRND